MAVGRAGCNIEDIEIDHQTEDRAAAARSCSPTRATATGSLADLRSLGLRARGAPRCERRRTLRGRDAVRCAARCACRATSRSRIAPCSSPRWPRARRTSRACWTRPTCARRSRRCARWAPSVDVDERRRRASTSTVAGWGGLGPRAGDDRSTAATAARPRGCSWACSPGGRDATFTLTGDESLSARPMRRVLDPLASMGARVGRRPGGHAAGRSSTGRRCAASTTTLPVASAQVKSAVLLAGLRAEGETVVREPLPSRDHTERCCPRSACPSDAPRTRARAPGATARRSRARPTSPCPATRPRRRSSSAAALVVPGSEVALAGVDLNPTRIGFLRVLERMGASIRLHPAGRRRARSPSATCVAVVRRRCEGTTVTAEEVPVARRRGPAARRRRDAGVRHDAVRGRRRAARQGVRPARGARRRRSTALGATVRVGRGLARGRRARAPARRRRWTRSATTGSRWRTRSRRSSRTTPVDHRGLRRDRRELPRLRTEALARR